MSAQRAKEVLDFNSTQIGYGIFETSVMVAELLMTEHDDYLKIDSIGVLKQAQGKGYGKLLLTTADKEATTRKLHQIKLVVRNDNATAIALYERYGYVRTGTAKVNLTFIKETDARKRIKSPLKNW